VTRPPDLAALEALAEAIDGEWACSHDEPSTHRPPDTYDVYLADGSAEVLANLPWELAAYIAAADPQTVLWLIREVERLRESIAGSPDKAQRLASLVASSTRLVQIERDDARTRAEKAEATIERVRELADSWIGSRSDLGPVTRACGALLRAALDGGEPDA